MTYILKDHPSGVWKMDLKTNNEIKKRTAKECFLGKLQWKG